MSYMGSLHPIGTVRVLAYRADLTHYPFLWRLSASTIRIKLAAYLI